jgi:hypothetical protein
VEHLVSAMKIVKMRLHNRMRDEFLNDCFVIYVERDMFNNLDNEIIQLFQNIVIF